MTSRSGAPVHVAGAVESGTQGREGEDGGVEDRRSRSMSTEMARSSVTVRESETERDEEDRSMEAPERRRRGREPETDGEPRAETGDGVDERRDRESSGEERSSGCAAR